MPFSHFFSVENNGNNNIMLISQQMLNNLINMKKDLKIRKIAVFYEK